MHFQTCSRHPQAGRFLAECYGCKRDLFDLQARNEANAVQEKAARTALAAIDTDSAAVILSVTHIGTALVVAAEQPSGNFRYTVDTFRLPTGAETDPELVDPRTPGGWVLIDQYGDHGPDDVPRMVQDAVAYLAALGIASTADDSMLAAA
jgi:hypothetical protein